REGSLWVGTHAGGLNRLGLARGETRFTHLTLKDEPWVRSFCEDREGTLWMGTDQGLSRVDRSAPSLSAARLTTLTTREGLSNNVVCVIREDREGTLWIGTFGGLNRFRD